MVNGHQFDKEIGAFIFREPRERTPRIGPDRVCTVRDLFRSRW